MTPHRDQNSGTLILDRICGKLGRIKVASGTLDPEEFRALHALITRLKRERRWDILSLVQQRLVKPLEIMDAFHSGTAHLLPTADDVRPVRRTAERWLAQSDYADNTMAGYSRDVAKIPATLTLSGLPAFLTERRGKEKRNAFNSLLFTMRAYLRDTAPEHRVVKQLPKPLDVEHRPGNPQEPDQIRALASHFRFADELWAICLTGMRAGEYWGKWEATSDRVLIGGTKTLAARRAVPLVYRPSRPRIKHGTFYDALHDVTDKALNVHDLRKTAQRWWEDAGIPDWRVSLYAGHARGKKMLETIYRKPRDLTRLLTEDAERVRAFLGDPPQLGLQVLGA